MKPYRLIIHPKAEKEFKKLENNLGKRLIDKIYSLSDNPRPTGYKKLTNYKSNRTPDKSCFRIRLGDIRIIYTIEDDIITVTIVQIKKRGDIY
jgi:mRNA interferase RelE/StbE